MRLHLLLPGLLLLAASLLPITARAADLSVQVGLDRGTVQRGAWFDIGFIVGNQESAPVERYRVALFASRDDQLDGSDVALGQFDARRPVAGISFQENSLRIDSCVLEPGSWRIIAALTGVEPADENPRNDLAVAGNALDLEPGGQGACLPELVNAGLNDAWFDPASPGQGVFLTVLPASGQLFLGWFTFAPEPSGDDAPARLGDARQRWLTGIGPVAGRVGELNLTNSVGGRFDQPAPQVENETDYGSVRVEVEDCERVRLHYVLPATGLEGSIELRRVVPDNAALCAALAGA